MRRSSGYLFYRIIDKLVDYCFPPLNKIDQNIEQVEDMIFGENVRQTVYEISLIRRDIIAFRRIDQAADRRHVKFGAEIQLAAAARRSIC